MDKITVVEDLISKWITPVIGLKATTIMITEGVTPMVILTSLVVNRH